MVTVTPALEKVLHSDESSCAWARISLSSWADKPFVGILSILIIFANAVKMSRFSTST